MHCYKKIRLWPCSKRDCVYDRALFRLRTHQLNSVWSKYLLNNCGDEASLSCPSKACIANDTDTSTPHSPSPLLLWLAGICPLLLIGWKEGLCSCTDHSVSWESCQAQLGVLTFTSATYSTFPSDWLIFTDITIYKYMIQTSDALHFSQFCQSKQHLLHFGQHYEAYSTFPCALLFRIYIIQWPLINMVIRGKWQPWEELLMLLPNIQMSLSLLFWWG